MNTRFRGRRREFTSVGAVRPDQLGLRSRDARRLGLESAWREVAGDALARRARVVGLKRGVLEVEVAASDWIEAVKALMPRLAGRLSRRFPELGVRRFRIRDGERVGRVETPDFSDAADDPQQPGPSSLAEPIAAPVTPADDASGTDDSRLRRLMERYLARAGQNP